MPIEVDEQERRTRLAEAVWTLVEASGLEAASVRNVARESGLSTGSVRHFFPTQASLHACAMELVMARVAVRAAALELPADPVDAAVLALGQLLPLDDERRRENHVWMAFGAAALVEPALGQIRARAYDDLRSVAAHWVARLCPDDVAAQRDWETERLSALVDGLAVHAALRPDSATAEVLLGVLSGHLAQLAGHPRASLRRRAPSPPPAPRRRPRRSAGPGGG